MRPGMVAVGIGSSHRELWLWCGHRQGTYVTPSPGVSLVSLRRVEKYVAMLQRAVRFSQVPGNADNLRCNERTNQAFFTRSTRMRVDLGSKLTLTPSL